MHLVGLLGLLLLTGCELLMPERPRTTIEMTKVVCIIANAEVQARGGMMTTCGVESAELYAAERIRDEHLERMQRAIDEAATARR